MVAMIIVVVGLVAFGLGRLTPGSNHTGQEPTSTTTSVSLQTPVTQIDRATWSVANIETSQQFTWHQTKTIDTWPIGLYKVEDNLLLFGSPTPFYEAAGESGLDLWTSTSGLSWEAKGQVIPPKW